MPNITPDSSPYLQAILREPAKLQALLDGGLDGEAGAFLDDVESRFKGIVITGMGSSMHAAYPLFLKLLSASIPVWVIEASELLQYGRGLLKPDRLVWAISQSGASAEIVALLDQLSETGSPVLGTVNQVESPLGERADVVIEMKAGPESGVGTASYINTLAVNELAASRILGADVGPELSDAPTRMDAYLADWNAHIAAMQSLDIGRGPTFVLGRGSSLAGARTGALIIKEAAKVHAEAMSPAEFRHGPLELADQDFDAIVFSGDPQTVELNRTLARDIIELGGSVSWLGPDPGPGAEIAVPDCTGSARPLGEILPMQLLSIAMGETNGVDPGVFRNMQGVTRIL
jgi:glucosamine--fructose-6-phosphate aminotransferase (isomerizing)